MKSKLNEMMSTIPTEKGDNVDAQILRVGIISEMDAVSLYEQLASVAYDEDLKKTLLDIAKEEKTHIGEFNDLLLKIDPEYKKELNAGAKEVGDNTEPDSDSVGVTDNTDSEDEESEDMNEARQRIYGKTATQKLNEMQNMFKKLIK